MLYTFCVNVLGALRVSHILYALRSVSSFHAFYNLCAFEATLVVWLVSRIILQFGSINNIIIGEPISPILCCWSLSIPRANIKNLYFFKKF